MMAESVVVRTLKARPLTPEAFKPFGWVLSVPRDPPRWELDLDWCSSQAWHAADLDMDGGVPEVQVFIMRTKSYRFSMMERHIQETQVLIPLDRQPAIFPVAPPSDNADPDAYPDPDRVAAFLLDGSAGLVMRKGTWHWGPFVLGQSASFINMTRKGKFDDMVRGHKRDMSVGDFDRKDLSRKFRIIFELSLPGH